MRQCVELLASISAAVDRNTKIMDLVANHIMHGRPGATGETKTSSSAVQESEDESDENLSEVKTRRFRARAKRPKHKDANELCLRVSGISTNRLIDLVVSTSPQDEVRKHANTMMGRNRSIEAEPAPEATVLHFKHTGKVEDGPSVDRFQPDFSEKHPERSLWNLRLVEVFTNDYVQKGLPVNEVKEVSRYFMTYLRSLQDTHRRKSTTASSGRGTVHDEVQRHRRIEERKKTVRSAPLLYA